LASENPVPGPFVSAGCPVDDRAFSGTVPEGRSDVASCPRPELPNASPRVTANAYTRTMVLPPNAVSSGKSFACPNTVLLTLRARPGTARRPTGKAKGKCLGFGSVGASCLSSSLQADQRVTREEQPSAAPPLESLPIILLLVASQKQISAIDFSRLRAVPLRKPPV